MAQQCYIAVNNFYNIHLHVNKVQVAYNEEKCKHVMLLTVTQYVLEADKKHCHAVSGFVFSNLLCFQTDVLLSLDNFHTGR